MSEKKTKTIESKLERVDEIAEILTNEEIELDKSIEYFQEAMKLIEEIEGQIKEAKDKIKNAQKA